MSRTRHNAAACIPQSLPVPSASNCAVWGDTEPLHVPGLLLDGPDLTRHVTSSSTPPCIGPQPRYSRHKFSGMLSHGKGRPKSEACPPHFDTFFGITTERTGHGTHRDEISSRSRSRKPSIRLDLIRTYGRRLSHRSKPLTTARGEFQNDRRCPLLDAAARLRHPYRLTTRMPSQRAVQARRAQGHIDRFAEITAPTQWPSPDPHRPVRGIRSV
ncbi:hypothetical protein N657DRAFT_128722 [Parathielavia appendiculata]|uniref:Uncharacterized protein n=1 Tax=Parathielavia appendiculata TaxID=2587402 RepID=A0AAN6Z2B2_9PEZI|nr:hypothetical protein N657DRAFT_128722 [Parathielavia appendiculata]